MGWTEQNPKRVAGWMVSRFYFALIFYTLYSFLFIFTHFYAFAPIFMHKLQLAARGCARPGLAWLMHRRYFYAFALIFMQALYNPKMGANAGKWVQACKNG